MNNIKWNIEFNSKMSVFIQIFREMKEDRENLKIVDIIRYFYLKGQLVVIVDELKDVKLINEYHDFIRDFRIDAFENYINDLTSQIELGVKEMD